jgi:UDP-N-acetylglucosamine diphosphorylase/glucosamine-1-phosphate N-acetyltransferase
MLLLFEDEHWCNFAPLSHTRPLFDMRCGAFTPRERVEAWVAAYASASGAARPHMTYAAEGASTTTVATSPAVFTTRTPAYQTHGLCRPYLMECYGPHGGSNILLQESEPLTLMNARAMDMSWLHTLLDAPVGTVYETAGILLGARLSPALASIALYYLREQQSADALEELRRFGHVVEVDTPLMTFPWDLIQHAGEQIVRDMPLLAARLPRYQAATDSHIVTHKAEHIYVAPSAQLDGPLVLDARDGPIFIDDAAHIEPFSYIQGPTYIGARSLISSALIRGETSIGPVCRIGGEVEASTIQAFTNKHHEGFLGHSWLGEWVNIGAMTTTSDLKNTYGSVKVNTEPYGLLDSGLIKLGCFLADHVKLGIGLHLTGGAIIGTGSNLFGIHMTPKTVPPFTWGSEVFYEYQIERMISVTRRVMQRRKQELTPAYETMLKAVFALTRSRRGEPGSPLSLSSTAGQSAEALEHLAQVEAEILNAPEHHPQPVRQR